MVPMLERLPEVSMSQSEELMARVLEPPPREMVPEDVPVPRLMVLVTDEVPRLRIGAVVLVTGVSKVTTTALSVVVIKK